MRSDPQPHVTAFSSALTMKFGISASKNLKIWRKKFMSKKFYFWSNCDPNRPTLNVQMTLKKVFLFLKKQNKHGKII